MSDLRELYQEVILDHNRAPRNFGPLEGASHTAHGDNPLCGDSIKVHLKMEAGELKAVGFEGSGCAICVASTSIMTDAVCGRTPEEVEGLFLSFTSMVKGEGIAVPLGKLAVFGGVREFPMRVKCATLCWHTLKAALSESIQTVTTE